MCQGSCFGKRHHPLKIKILATYPTTNFEARNLKMSLQSHSRMRIWKRSTECVLCIKRFVLCFPNMPDVPCQFQNCCAVFGLVKFCQARFLYAKERREILLGSSIEITIYMEVAAQIWLSSSGNNDFPFLCLSFSLALKKREFSLIFESLLCLWRANHFQPSFVLYHGVIFPFSYWTNLDIKLWMWGYD